MSKAFASDGDLAEKKGLVPQMGEGLYASPLSATRTPGVVIGDRQRSW